MKHEDRIKTISDRQDLENFSSWPLSQEVSGAWRRKSWTRTSGNPRNRICSPGKTQEKVLPPQLPSRPGEESVPNGGGKQRAAREEAGNVSKKRKLKINWKVTWHVRISWEETSVSFRDFVDELVVNTQKTKCSQFVEQVGTLGCRKKRSLFLDAKFILCIFKLFFPYPLEWSLGPVSWLF